MEKNHFFFFLKQKKKRKGKKWFSQNFILIVGMGMGRAKVDCNEENDLNGRMVVSCLQVYRNEIKVGLSIAKQ